MCGRLQPVVDHPSDAPVSLTRLVAERALDSELGALLWLLVEGGLPLVVAGGADLRTREAIGGAVLAVGAGPGWALLDEAEATLDGLAGLLRQGTGLGLTVAAVDLRDVLARLESGPTGLPVDAVRRLGVVLIVDLTASGPRVTAAHYLRPTERDAEGHVQRRPPAVLATWDREADRHEHFAWGITPELGDRVGRAQADLEERQRDRAAFLSRLVGEGVLDQGRLGERVTAYVATEPARQPAAPPTQARPSPFHGGLSDPHVH
jgi:hypothetical protein